MRLCITPVSAKKNKNMWICFIFETIDFQFVKRRILGNIRNPFLRYDSLFADEPEDFIAKSFLVFKILLWKDLQMFTFTCWIPIRTKEKSKFTTAWKVPVFIVFGVFLIRIFPHSDQKNSKYWQFSCSALDALMTLDRGVFRSFSSNSQKQPPDVLLEISSNSQENTCARVSF